MSETLYLTDSQLLCRPAPRYCCRLETAKPIYETQGTEPKTKIQTRVFATSYQVRGKNYNWTLQLTCAFLNLELLYKQAFHPNPRTLFWRYSSLASRG